MDEAFDTALVTGYKSIIPSLDLPDANDRHLLAAAIKCGATFIVTENRKDFTAGFFTKAGYPTSFITDVLEIASAYL